MNPIRIYREHYGARLFPCRKPRHVGDEESKAPLNKGWRTAEHSDAELVEFWKAGHPLAWALAENDLVVDIDAPSKHKPGKQGLESFKKLNNLLGVPLSSVAPEVHTGHNGGSHFYLTAENSGELRTSLKDELPDIDFRRHGNYVVIAGSPHWLGGSYNFSPQTELLDDYRRPECPATLLDMLQRVEGEASNVEAAQVTPETLARMLGCLNINHYDSNDTWFPILVASHHATGGSVEGLAVFLDWSLSDPKYAGDADKIRHRWQTFDASTPGGITVGTLFKELDFLGFDDVASMVRTAIEFDFEPDDDGGGLFDDEPIDGSGLFDEPPKPRKTKRRKRKKIIYGLDELTLNRKIIAELASMPNLFQRSGFLCTINDADILPLNPLGICEHISSVCDLGINKENKREKTTEWESRRIPERVGKQIAARGSWFGVRRLKMVTSIPLMTAGGVLQTPGYDPLSCVFYAPSIEIKPVAKHPTLEAARAAAATLFDVVHDFPFAGDSHRSAWLASLLAVIARPAIDGPVPMTFIDGNQRGVGKGLLTDLVYLILYGANMPKHASMPRDEAEMAKVLLSIAMRNRPTYNFDNVPSGSRIGSPSLDSVLTTGTVAGRVLGKSEVHDYEIETVFFGSGNRIAVDQNTDIIRRLNYINLQSPEEHAEHRTGFKHGAEAELREYAINKRAELIHAALTILEYSRQSKADPTLKSWGSYEAFSRVVRRAIVLLGEPDPLDTRKALEARDESRGALEIVIAAIEGIGATSLDSGMTAAEIIAELTDAWGDEHGSTYTQAAQLLSPPGTDNASMRCGIRLAKRYRDQVSGGRWIKKQVCPSRKLNVFWVEPVENSNALFKEL